MKLLHIVLTVLVMTLSAMSTANSEQYPQIIVNGSALSDSDIEHMIGLYGQIYVGRYWYDKTSGLYGYEGKGPAGQLHAGLVIGGQLAASASGGGNGALTGVFINGREIHPDEYAFLRQLFGQVLPGHFWMNAKGVGGYEGGAAFFNVAQAMRRAGGHSGDSHYMPWLGAAPGTHVGRASDGCVYISQGGYSNDFC